MSHPAPLPCPFCGAPPVARMDGAEPRPFFIWCAHPSCPAHNSETRFADPELAMTAWNRRAQMPPPKPQPTHLLAGFTTRNLIRGEMVWFDLDRTGVLTSDAMRFGPHSKPLMLKPTE